MLKGYEWFDRSIYQDRNDLEYWRQMLGERIALSDFVGSQPDTPRNSANKAARIRFKELLQATKFIDSSSGDYQSYLQAYKRAFAQGKVLPPALVMRLSDLLELKAWANSDAEVTASLDAERAHSDKWTGKLVRRNGKLVRSGQRPQGSAIKEFMSVQALFDKALTEFVGYQSALGTSNYAPLLLDLTAPEKDVVQALRLIRKSFQASSRSRSERNPHSHVDIEIQNWIEYGVLPYFDLKLYERISGVPISIAQMADLIWPPESSREELEVDLIERLKKTTAKYSRTIFKPSFLKKLR